jgi:N utilization substance protein B
MTRRSRAREVALQLLFQHDFNPSAPRGAVEQLAQDRLRIADLTAFCLSLYDGVLAHREEIDRRLTESAENWRLPRMAAVDRNVLRLGALEVLFTPETPPEVAINEAIELARRYGSADSPAFVNGVLDRLRRSAAAPAEGDQAPAPGADGTAAAGQPAAAAAQEPSPVGGQGQAADS